MAHQTITPELRRWIVEQVVAADVVADAAVVLVRKVALQSSVQPRQLVDQPMTTLKTMSSMWMLI